MKKDKYVLLKGYQKNDQYRAAFNSLSKKVFGLSFEDWYQSGYWNEKYIPYTLFDGEIAVANVSINIMDFSVLSKKQHYVQLGTVMTDVEYRNQGLSRLLIEKVFEDWNSKCDLIYLYANKSVLSLYPKFGFSPVKEFEYFKQVEKKETTGDYKKLDMGQQSNRDMLYEYAKNTQSFAKISMKNNTDLVMFYCTSFLKDAVYYIDSLDIIAIANFTSHQLHLLDVFGKKKIALERVIQNLIKSQTKEILLGFTPENSNAYQAREIHGDDMLFIQAEKTNLFVENKMMFPILSHA